MPEINELLEIAKNELEEMLDGQDDVITRPAPGPKTEDLHLLSYTLPKNMKQVESEIHHVISTKQGYIKNSLNYEKEMYKEYTLPGQTAFSVLYVQLIPNKTLVCFRMWPVNEKLRNELKDKMELILKNGN